MVHLLLSISTGQNNQRYLKTHKKHLNSLNERLTLISFLFCEIRSLSTKKVRPPEIVITIMSTSIVKLMQNVTNFRVWDSEI